MIVTGQQSQVLAGEYLPANRDAPDANSGTRVNLPSGGAILQRVTVVTARPDDTVVFLHADYSPPAISQSGTYESLSANARYTGEPAAQDASTPQPGEASRTRAPSAASYTKVQQRSATRASSKGGVIDVFA